MIWLIGLEIWILINVEFAGLLIKRNIRGGKRDDD